MNFDLDTPEGLAAAAQWTNNLLSMIREGGHWVIPRSGTVVTVLSHSDKHVSLSALNPEPSVRRVLEAGGWTILHVILNSQNDE